MSMAVRSHEPASAAGSGRSRRPSIGKVARVLTPHGPIMISHTTRVNSAPGGKDALASQRRTSSAKAACSDSVSGASGGVAAIPVGASIALSLAPTTDQMDAEIPRAAS